jgi:hypothetical protein
MKLFARMMAFISFLAMFQYANAAGNSVYVEQIGSGSTINFTQTGTNNEIGNATTAAIVNGNNNSVTVDQIGNSNIARINVDGTGATISSTVTGDSNTVDINCGSGGTCGASQITNTITGDGNSVTQHSDGLMDSTVNITSDNNTVSITNTSTAVSGAKSNVDISSGGGNTVAIIQAGAAGANGHDASVTIVGATNNVDVRQGGSVDSKVVSTITGSGNNLTVKSNHQ